MAVGGRAGGADNLVVLTKPFLCSVGKRSERLGCRMDSHYAWTCSTLDVTGGKEGHSKMKTNAAGLRNSD